MQAEHAVSSSRTYQEATRFQSNITSEQKEQRALRPSLGLIIEVERHWLSGESRSDFQSGLGAREQPKSPQSIAQRRLLTLLPLFRTPSDITTPSKWLAVPLVGEYRIAQTVGTTFPASKCAYWRYGRYCGFRQSGDVVPGRNHPQRVFANIFTATATASKDPTFARFVLRPENTPLKISRISKTSDPHNSVIFAPYIAQHYYSQAMD